MKKIKIVGGLIAGPGFGWNVDQVLDSLDRCCDQIIVIDNSMGEHTAKLIAHPKVYFCLHQKRNTRYGGRDYTKIYNLAKYIDADWVLVLDLDEELDPECNKEKLVEAIERNYYPSMAFEVYEMVDDEDYFICHRTVHRFWKVEKDLCFNMTSHGCASPSEHHPGAHLNMYIKHFGHMDKDLRAKKKKEYFGDNPEYLDEKEIEAIFFDEELIQKEKIKWKDRFKLTLK